MASSPPGSPSGLPQRPASAMMRQSRANSRMSMTSKAGGGSRASDEDSKTSVKVAVRIRPPLNPSDPGFDLIPQRFQRCVVQNPSSTNISIESGPQGRKLFVFDKVFGEDVDQEGVWDYLVESINAFVQGYNVSMLAYGQSGAGKSYTMGTSGPEQQADPAAMGVIPRAAAALFEHLEGPKVTPKNSASGLRTPSRYSMQSPSFLKPAEKSWSLKATYLEIYNEHLRDLLVPETVPVHERGVVSIREDTKGHILLTGLYQVDINSVDDLLNALNHGSMIRQTDSTAINAKSSRSHAVFSLNLVQRKSKSQVTPASEKRFSVPLESTNGNEGWVTIDSKLHFVDLAGSERLKNTGAQGERAKEGISINAGLAALGKVISQLSRNSGSHISYRDSKLTRLLQDSLGGNAITYMIACVTPAEFHLSETLNTVQYAQRARAIQSKPRIQQVSDEGDKQGLIDRLKAEVAFLREQIRSTERGSDRRNSYNASEKSDRQNERGIELQNQLLDLQENYSSLGQRHAKLISEMTKARDQEDAENSAYEATLGDTATERLKRSNTFAAAVEQVVLEYETTIQSLEQLLSSTRGSLSSNEAALLEKETKCAYVETVNTQLQARLQKMIDREASTENYLHDLEARLDGHTSGEEKNSAVVVELRKEIARLRENEASCEDYISTLEERLAEADQDTELMQREIDRLEHVVERQRSLGKLDNLLYELDHIQKDTNTDDKTTVNGKRNAIEQHSRNSVASRGRKNGIILENGEEDQYTFGEKAARSASQGPLDHGEPIEEDDEEKVNGIEYPPTSPAQSKFVADKLEDTTQELLDLRVEHEATVSEFELLSTKYEDALRTLAELQDTIDETRRPAKENRDSMLSVASPTTGRPLSFLADARVNELVKVGQSSSSRSLSSELSLAGGLPSPLDSSDANTAEKKMESGVVTNGFHYEEELAVEVEELKRLAAEKERAEAILTKKYAQLEKQHDDTLDLVEELKADISKFKLNEGISPTPVIRRKSSQNVMIIDRAHRSFASLRNIATENFEDNPDVMQNFELNLNTAMHELHSRSERVQELEADIAAVKKEMETKMTIISGLTRERSSLKNSSPMDISVVSTMQTQLAQREITVRSMQEAHAIREKELAAEISSLQAKIESLARSSDNEASRSLGEQEDLTATHNKRVADLELELSSWEAKHQTALEAMAELESRLATTSEMKDSTGAEHSEVLENLQKELEEHKALVNTNAARVAELEESHAVARELLDEANKSRETTAAELSAHKELVSQLEQRIAEHENVVSEYQTRIEALISEHHTNTEALQSDLSEARDALTKIASQFAVTLGVDASIADLEERIASLLADRAALLEENQKSVEVQEHFSALVTTNDSITKELELVKAELAALLSTTEQGTRLKADHATVSEQLAILRKEMADLEKKNKKNSRLVEELEDQLASNFDSHQAANNRLSTLQSERHSQLEEATAAALKAQTELDAIKEEYAVLQAKFEDVQPVEGPGAKRSNSTSNNPGLKKSASVASLPSPPPAIPLPPLPGSIGGTISPNQGQNGPSPASPRPSSREVALLQINQDHEARIRTIEKHLYAEKQLTSTLEEALTDLERQSNKTKTDCDAWRRRAGELEQEIKELREKPQQENRWSIHQVEEERKKRKDAEIARAHLEERMNAINKKKKKGSLNCF